jgi:hypothetical protein
MAKETKPKKEMNKTTVSTAAKDNGGSDSPSVGLIGFLLTAAYLILLSILLVVAIVQCWPSSAATRGSASQLSQANFLIWSFSISDEARLILIIVLAGALGGQVRSIRSLAWYVGNKELKRSWLPQYILTPFVGATLAIVTYFVIRGGFFSANTTVQQTSTYGFAGLASLVGIASEPVALKLKAVAETLFTKPKQGKDSSPQE